MRYCAFPQFIRDLAASQKGRFFNNTVYVMSLCICDLSICFRVIIQVLHIHRQSSPLHCAVLPGLVQVFKAGIFFYLFCAVFCLCKACCCFQVVFIHFMAWSWSFFRDESCFNLLLEIGLQMVDRISVLILRLFSNFQGMLLFIPYKGIGILIGLYLYNF